MNDMTGQESSEVMLEGPRPARLEERDPLIEMVNFVFRTNLGREPTVARDWEHVYAPENLGNVNVICDLAQQEQTPGRRGKLVASTGVWANDVLVGETRLRVGGINCVGTLPEYRRHGLGAQVMRAAHRTMAELGCHVGLLGTGIANWYRQLGWEEAGVIRSYLLNRGNVALLPPLVDALRVRFVKLGEDEADVSPDLLTEMVRLHNKMRLGGVRDVAGFRRLITARQVQDCVVAEGEDGLAAYLLFAENRVYEWAGDAAVVAGLVTELFGQLDDRTISTSQRINSSGSGGSMSLRHLTLVTPGKPHDLVDSLDRVRIPYSSDYLGMMYVVDPQATLDAFGLSSIRVEEGRVDESHSDENHSDHFVLRYGDATLQVTRGQLVKLLFGPEQLGDFAADLLPLPFWQWGIEKV